MAITDFWGVAQRPRGHHNARTMRSFYGYWWFTDGRRPA